MAHDVTTFNVAQGAVRNYSFHNGELHAGIKLLVGLPKVKNNGEVYPPHVRCGEVFIALDRHLTPPTVKKGDDVYTYHAGIRTINPTSGGRSFSTLALSKEDDFLLYVDTFLRFNEKAKVKFDPQNIRAWVGIVADNDVEIVTFDIRTNVCLLQFTAEGQSVLVYLEDGSVHKIVRKGDALCAVKLSYVEMMELRVEQFQGEIDKLSDSEEDYRALHGILSGAIRLLLMTKSNLDVRRVLTSFLRTFVDDGLTYKMQMQVRTLLLGWNDTEAAFFVVGSNLVDLTSPKVGKPAQAKAKASLRSQRDREMREKMRGGSSGGGNNTKKKAGK